jgi:hypothetical protein
MTVKFGAHSPNRSIQSLSVFSQCAIWIREHEVTPAVAIISDAAFFGATFSVALGACIALGVSG